MEWEKIRAEWEVERTPLKKLAEKHGVSLGTLKSKKSREKWGADVATKQSEKVATKKKKVAEVATPKIVIENDDLDDKEILFCLEYIARHNATQSYLSVYKCGYNAARTNGSRMLAKANIQKELKRLKAMQRAESLLEAQDVFQKQVDIAFASITDYISFGRRSVTIGERDLIVNYVDLKSSEDVDGSLITEVKEGREGVSIKLMDKKQAFDFLIKHFDMLKDNEKKRLQEEKLKLDIAKAELDVYGEDDVEETIIVTSEAEMIRRMEAMSKADAEA